MKKTNTNAEPNNHVKVRIFATDLNGDRVYSCTSREISIEPDILLDTRTPRATEYKRAIVAWFTETIAPTSVTIQLSPSNPAVARFGGEDTPFEGTRQDRESSEALDDWEYS